MDCREIPLTRGKVAIVDASDFEWLSQWKWRASNDGDARWYAVRTVHSAGGRRWRRSFFVRMHREIIGAPPRILVDHRDGDGLHNWRDNLRLATPQQNQQNRRRLAICKSSRFLGVSWCLASNRWRAQIGIGKVKASGHASRVLLGEFTNEEAAARAYDAAALRYFGAFAAPNFPPPAVPLSISVVT